MHQEIGLTGDSFDSSVPSSREIFVVKYLARIGAAKV